MIKDFKLEMLIYFNSPIAKQYSPFQRTPHIFPIPLLNQEISAALEALGLQIFFQLQK
jgi:hypothetical protein